MTPTDRVMIFDRDVDRSAMIAAPLVAAGLTPNFLHDPAGAVEVLRRDRPELAIVVEGGFPGLVEAARSLGIPSLLVVETVDEPGALLGRVRPFDAWVSVESLAGELPTRVSALLGKGPGKLPLVNPKFLAMIIHDLRTPLNVIGLTIPTIGMSVPQKTPLFEEDLQFLHENAKQIERMLAQLADFCRLVEGEYAPSAYPFDPRRYLAEFLEARAGSQPSTIVLEVDDSSPTEVSLDPNRVRLALTHSVANAVIASDDTPVKLRSSGVAGRWLIEIIVDKSPPRTVSPTTIRPNVFERLTGSPAERRGFDLSLAASVSESFGGSVRLDVEPGKRTVIVLDWPTVAEQA